MKRCDFRGPAVQPGLQIELTLSWDSYILVDTFVFRFSCPVVVFRISYVVTY